MKIAYLIDWDILADSGVLKKIKAQIEIWEKNGNRVALFVSSYQTKKAYVAGLKEVFVFDRPYIKYIPHSLNTFLGKMIVFKRIKKAMKSFGPDIIYFRQSNMWYPGIEDVLKLAPTVMEVNTNDEEEIKIYYGKFRQRVYRLGKKLILRETKGLVAVTNEIGHQYSERISKITVIGNAINGFNTLPEVERSTNEVNILFVATAGQIWQGMDKVLALAEMLPDCSFHVVGETASIANGKNYSNVNFYGHLDQADLFKLYDQMHIGIGTLALHRKKMDEACPLKVREYLSFGLPVIVAYYDTDFAGKPFVLQIENTESNVENCITQIKDFIEKWKDKRVHQSDLVPFGKEQKEIKRLLFFKEIVDCGV